MKGRKIYAGDPIMDTYTLLIIFVFIIELWMYATDFTKSFPLFIVFVGPLAFYIFCGFQMNYFIIENNLFIIKNHYFPWKTKSYFLENISQVNIEKPYKKPNGLRIITSNEEQSKLYCTGSFRRRNWNELKQDLQSIGIPIRSDL